MKADVIDVGHVDRLLIDNRERDTEALKPLSFSI